METAHSELWARGRIGLGRQSFRLQVLPLNSLNKIVNVKMPSLNHQRSYMLNLINCPQVIYSYTVSMSDCSSASVKEQIPKKPLDKSLCSPIYVANLYENIRMKGLSYVYEIWLRHYRSIAYLTTT